MVFNSYSTTMATTLVIIITTLSFLHTGKASLLRGNKNRNAIIIDDRLPPPSSMHLRGFEGPSGRRMKKVTPVETTTTTSTTTTSSTTTQCGKM